MGFEIECGSCGNRFTVEQDGGIVECPHCETALQLPARPAGPGGVPVAPESGIEKAGSAALANEDRPVKPGSSVISEAVTAGLPTTSDSGELSDHMVFPGLPEAAAVSDVKLPSIDAGDGGQSAGSDSAVAISDPSPGAKDDADDAFPFPATLGDTFPNPDDPTVLDASMQEDLKQFVPKFDSKVMASPGGSAGASITAKKAAAQPAKMPAQESAAQAGGISRTVFFIVCGYASAVTIALIYLLLTQNRVHQIDRLPDVVPNPDGYIVPENAAMPPGHTLKIGQTQRYGNLEITPLRITRGNVSIVDDRGRVISKRADEPEILRLWLRIKNVSKTQKFKPFGRPLMFMTGKTEKRQRKAANIFVCRAEDKQQGGHLVYVYPSQDYNTRFEDQQLGRVLAPGDEYETFIASDEEGLDQLTGDLIWRVHVRKGYNPESKNGVTTIFEVTFHSDDIQSDGADG